MKGKNTIAKLRKKTAKFKLHQFVNNNNTRVQNNMVEITPENIVSFLSLLRFNLKSGEELTYSKTYSNNYEIKIHLDKDNFRNSKIDYGEKIKKDRETTCNFSQQENFVVLECVNRLLEKGYKPEDIILEQKFTVGH